MPRTERMRDLTEILRSGRASSQQAIVAELRTRGHEVTQATVSRDLRDIGAAKVRVGEDFEYRLPDEAGLGSLDPSGRNLKKVLDEFALSIERSGTLLVIKTPPGHASLLARAVDLANDASVVGTIAGDDTLFVALGDVGTADRVRTSWLSGRNGEVR